MSLIGLDIGSSAVKAAAFAEDGAQLAGAREPIAASHPAAGRWEVDPGAVWEAALAVLRRLAADPALGRDPPRALAVSASGREVFLADADGAALTPCLMAGDGRGAELARRLRDDAPAETWLERCGHVPEPMDPVVRTLWWREQQPELAARARRVLGWHELATLRLAGRAVVDPSLASRWLDFDLARGDWADDRRSLARELLPAVGEWGSLAGELEPSAARATGLPAGLAVAVGAFDVCCATLGAGVAKPGAAGLSCGSWQALALPVAALPPPATLLAAGCSAGAHPAAEPRHDDPGAERGRHRVAVFSLDPEGGVVLDWAARLTGRRLEDLEVELLAGDGAPSPVRALPSFADGDGALTGLSLATSPVELVAACGEAIAYRLALWLERLRAAGVAPQLLRASGGGTASGWRMQLTADLTGVPVEVAAENAAARGAALLAGLAVGVYGSLEEAAALARPRRRYEPRPERAALHAERLAELAA